MGYVIITSQKRRWPLQEQAKMHALAKLLELNAKERWITERFQPVIYCDDMTGIPPGYDRENVVEAFCCGGKVEEGEKIYYREYGYAIFREDSRYGYIVWLYSCLACNPFLGGESCERFSTKILEDSGS